MTINDIVKLTADYPRFSDGRIDYSHERVCFVVNCVVVCGDEVLLTRRSADVIAYPNTLNGVSGFLDRTDISIEEQIRVELHEELQAPLYDVQRLVLHEPVVQIDEEIKREWHVWIALAEFSKKFEPVINWENKSVRWHDIRSARRLELMPGFEHTLQIALSMRK